MKKLDINSKTDCEVNCQDNEILKQIQQKEKKSDQNNKNLSKMSNKGIERNM
jgi:hypothetical protein